MFASKIYKFKISDIEFKITIEETLSSSDWVSNKDPIEEAVQRMHCHALHELFFVKDSPLIVITEDKPLEFKNCVVCIPPMFVHSSIRHDDYRILFSYKINSEKPSKIAKYLDYVFCKNEPTSAKADNSIDTCFEQLLKLIQVSDKLSEEMVPSILKLIFYNIYSCNSDIEKGEELKTRDSYLIIIDRILDDYQKNINLESMAKALNLSTKQTSRIIRKNYKCTLAELVTQKKLGVACALLANSDMPVADIVEYVNFTSESYFYHQFKKAYGCTPLKYRKKR